MSRQRLVLWLALLALVLSVRWWDPMGHQTTTEAASAPVERTNSPVLASNRSPEAASSAATEGAWPVRPLTNGDEAGNAFLARGQIIAPPIEQVPVVAPAPVVYVPPPAPTPVEVPPPLQIIGTWGEEANLAVFLAGPQGTVLARSGDVILSDYRVQSITKQQLTLQQNSNQRSWNLAIPEAPSTLQTWPGK